MALAPHWLDDAFTDGKADTASVTKSITGLPGFRKAVESAQQAYREREKEFASKPGLMSGSPSQAARQAFLTALGQETHG